MVSWYRCNLGDATLADQALDKIKQSLLEEKNKESGSEDRAVFVRLETQRQLYCATVVYFPPELEALANSFNATPCAQPDINGLTLLTGSERSFLKYFPKK